MNKKTRILFFCITVLSPLVSSAQSDYLTVNEDMKKAENIDLGGKASFVFQSMSKELVITSNINSDDQKPQAKKNAGGYQYEFIVPVDRKRTFSIAKQGTALRTEVTKMPRKDQRFYFTVTEVANPITLENQSGRSDLYPVERKACIQFTTPISDLQVRFSDKLGGKLKREKAPSGANLITLEIDMDSLNKYRDNANLIQNKLDDINKTIRAKEQDPKSITDEEWDLQEKLQEELVKVQNAWIETSTIQLFGEGTNVLTIPANDILAIQTKSLTPYGILLLKEKVFASKYEELMHQANEFVERHDYQLAKVHYTSAAEVANISEVDKITAKRSAEKMEQLESYQKFLNTKADELYLLVNSGGMINKKKLFGMMDEVIKLNKSMYKETNDSYYLEEANRLTEEKQKVGLVLKGRFVMSEYKGGVVNETPITNVRIYGSQEFNNDDMDKPSYRKKGQLITTVTDPNGNYSINYQPGQYRTIIFEAVDNSQIKVNKHISIVGRSEDRNVKIRFPKK